MSDLITKHCPVCFVSYAIPRTMNDAKLADGTSWFCPNGHSLVFKDSTVDKLTRERDRLKQNAAYLEERNRQLAEARNTAERRASAARGQVTKLKNRVANGVCPCCNRTFANLARHMNTKHAGFVAEEVQAEVGQTIQ